jgi:hypothetical protein
MGIAIALSLNAGLRNTGLRDNAPGSMFTPQACDATVAKAECAAFPSRTAPPHTYPRYNNNQCLEEVYLVSSNWYAESEDSSASSRLCDSRE